MGLGENNTISTTLQLEMFLEPLLVVLELRGRDELGSATSYFLLFGSVVSVAFLCARLLELQGGGSVERQITWPSGYCRSRSVKQLQSLSFQPRSIAARSLVCMAKALDLMSRADH